MDKERTNTRSRKTNSTLDLETQSNYSLKRYKDYTNNDPYMLANSKKCTYKFLLDSDNKTSKVQEFNLSNLSESSIRSNESDFDKLLDNSCENNTKEINPISDWDSNTSKTREYRDLNEYYLNSFRESMIIRRFILMGFSIKDIFTCLIDIFFVLFLYMIINKHCEEEENLRIVNCQPLYRFKILDQN